MRRLRLQARRLVLERGRPKLQSGENEALVKVRLAGICGTDLQLVQGYYAFSGVPGHEFVGEVVECRQDPSRVGQRVVGEINVGCGQCPGCLSGDARHCPQRAVLGISRNGAFADYLTLPVGNLVRVPDSVSDRRAVFCEPLAAALHVLDDVPIGPDSQVLLIGAGRLGQLIAQVLAGTGCALSVMARHQTQIERLAARGIRVGGEDQRAAYDVVVEATGHPDGLEAALRRVRPRGTILLKSTYNGTARINLSPFVVDEVRVVGSRCGDLRAAMRLLADSTIETESLIDSVFPLEQGLEAFERAARPGVLKVLLDCS